MINAFTGKYRFLSNFYVFPNGKTLEHFYQASKTEDPKWQVKILNAETPGKAKRLGRQAPLNPIWDNIKEIVMLELIRNKFSDPVLAELLVSTLPHELIEENTWNDIFWGVCNGVGENKLGIILTQVRDEVVNAFLENLQTDWRGH